MNPETERLLGILEFYKSSCRRMFVWDSSIRGYFNIWNLLLSERFVYSTEPEKAIKHWRNVEIWGTPTNQKKECIQYAPFRRERGKRSDNSYLLRERIEYYQALLYFLKKSLQNLQAYILTGYASSSLNLNFEQAEFCIVLGQTVSQDWICLAPTAPDQIWGAYPRAKHPNITSLTSCKSENSDTQDLVEKINKIIARLKPIEIYGYYYGGYDYSYDHQILCTSSSDLASSIELALQASTMLDIDGEFSLYDDDDNWNNDRDRISRFMHKHLKNRKCFTVSFWDVGYGYDLGCTPTGDWIGFKEYKEFEYNP